MEICPEMYAIANIANIADTLQKSQILQNYSSERLRNPITDIADTLQKLQISQNYSNERLGNPIADIADIANIPDTL